MSHDTRIASVIFVELLMKNSAFDFYVEKMVGISFRRKEKCQPFYCQPVLEKSRKS